MQMTPQCASTVLPRTKVFLVNQDATALHAIRLMVSCCPEISFDLCPDNADCIFNADLDQELDFDLIIFEGNLALSQSFNQYNVVRRTCPTKPIIVVSANQDEEVANLALKHGAQDYLLAAELNAKVLDRAVRYAVRRHQQQLTLMQKTDSLQKIFLELKQANQDLRQLATTDGLTHIFNRRYFNTALTTEWNRAAREEQPLSIVLCDIDFFKAYNDTYGHRAGDRCLQQVAQALATAVHRPADIVARYGGEEFAIILPNTNRDGAFSVARTLHQAISRAKIEHVNTSVSDRVTMSFGVATQVPIGEVEASELVEAADRALYTAKENGRNGIHRSPAHISLKKTRIYSSEEEVSPPIASLNAAS